MSTLFASCGEKNPAESHSETLQTSQPPPQTTIQTTLQTTVQTTQTTLTTVKTTEPAQTEVTTNDLEEKENLASALVSDYLKAVIDDAFFSIPVDLDKFASNAPSKDHLTDFTESLVYEILGVSVQSDFVTKYTVSTDVGNFRKEGIYYLTDGTISAVATVNGVESELLSRTVCFTIRYENGEAKFSNAIRVTESDDPFLYDVQNRTTLSDLNIDVYSAGPDFYLPPQEVFSASFVKWHIHNSVTGLDDAHSVHRISDNADPSDMLFAHCVLANLYRNLSYSGSPTVSILAQTLSINEETANVRITVSADITVTSTVFGLQGESLAGIYDFTLDKDEFGEWQLKSMEPVNAPVSLEKLSQILNSYSQSFFR